MNIMHVLWIFFWSMFALLNATREIIFYGLQGRSVPFFSYWGYIIAISCITIAPAIIEYLIFNTHENYRNNN